MLAPDLFQKPGAGGAMQDRYYQSEAVEAVFDFWAEGGKNPLVNMATGTGKSVVIARIAQRVLTQFPDMRILIPVHVKELVQQNALALLRAWPGAPIGINSAGLGRRDRSAQILFGSIQSIFRKPELLGPRDLIMPDESHLVPQGGEGMYLQMLEKMRELVPDLQVCGFTATPYRLDSGRLDQGKDRIFSQIVYSYDVGDGVRDGYLSALVSKATATEINVAGVKRQGGEFNAGQLEAAANNDAIIASACNEICQRGADRKGWLLFCSGISHALNVRDALRQRGINAETVTADTPGGERDRIFAQYKEGRIRALTGMNVFTTGFDAPHVDLIACLRPTLSTGLYVQMLGRGTRPVYASGYDLSTPEARHAAIAAGPKPNCLVLDYAGNVRMHGPIDDIYIEPKREKAERDDDGERPYAVKPDSVRARVCPECESLNSLKAQTCVDCGYEWPIKHEAVADNSAIMKKDVPKWKPIEGVEIFRHEKPGKPPSLRVEYRCGYKSFREWICFEHSGFPKAKAHSYWRMIAGTPPPKTVNEAIERRGEINAPAAITVKRDGSFHQVTGYLFNAEGGSIAFDGNYRGDLVDESELGELATNAPALSAPETERAEKRPALAGADLDDEIPF